jgi:hypothetical protein
MYTAALELNLVRLKPLKQMIAGSQVAEGLQNLQKGQFN